MIAWIKGKQHLVDRAMATKDKKIAWLEKENAELKDKINEALPLKTFSVKSDGEWHTVVAHSVERWRSTSPYDISRHCEFSIFGRGVVTMLDHVTAVIEEGTC